MTKTIKKSIEDFLFSFFNKSKSVPISYIISKIDVHNNLIVQYRSLCILHKIKNFHIYIYI